LISPTGASVGIGLAIPAEAAKPVIDSLMRGQRPSRGYLGVGLADVAIGADAKVLCVEVGKRGIEFGGKHACVTKAL